MKKNENSNIDNNKKEKSIYEQLESKRIEEIPKDLSERIYKRVKRDQPVEPGHNSFSFDIGFDEIRKKFSSTPEEKSISSELKRNTVEEDKFRKIDPCNRSSDEAEFINSIKNID